MRFVRGLWKLLVGIKDALVLILLLLFFGGLYAALSVRPTPVGEGVLVLDMEGALVEQPSEPDLLPLLSGQGSRLREHRLRDLISALDAARDDSRVKGVALDLDGFLGGGHAAVADLGDAIGRFRTSGKPVIAFATGYTDSSYLLASHASEVWLNPMGLVAVRGPGGQSLYYKGLLDKLGVTANVYRVGSYKAAVEPYIRNDMSPEARRDAQALGNALLENYLDRVRSARPSAAILPYIRDTPGVVAAAGGDLAQAALRSRLVDRLGTRRDFEERLRTLGGDDPDDQDGFNRVDLRAYVADANKSDVTGPIGILTVAGMIVDGEAGPGTAGAETIVDAIEEALEDGGLKALVVRIDSPGGSAIASERIRQALLEVRRRRIPVVVSMGSVAASGGYWTAMAGQHVFAEPGTVTGSIGVFGILPSFQGTAEKLGLGTDGIKTTPLSGEPDLFNGPSPEASMMIQATVNSTYRRFVALVSQARRLPPGRVEELAQGRVWDGGSARQLGLVDQFGDLNDAIGKARALAGLKSDAKVRYLERGPGVRDEILTLLAGDDEAASGGDEALQALGPAPARLVERALADARGILAGPSIQAYCLECPAPATHSSPIRDTIRQPSLISILQWLLP